MSRASARRPHPVLEKCKRATEKEKQNQNILSRYLKRVYPIGLDRSSSSLSLSSLSLSLSQNSNESSLTDSSSTPLDQKISHALRLITPLHSERTKPPITKVLQQPLPCPETSPQELKRCNWITKNSDKVYVAFHDECWGVPAYDDSQLFELLALSGILMDYNWTEILKRKQLLRESFAGFEPNAIVKMEESKIEEIVSNKEISLSDSRVRCILDNAKCTVKIAKEFGSFSNYIWGHVNHKPVINRFKHPRNVPLRSPKAEAVSKDLIKRGFRFVGPVIVYSFMQAAGLTIDHLVDCYRHSDCVNLAQRPWRHI